MNCCPLTKKVHFLLGGIPAFDVIPVNFLEKLQQIFRSILERFRIRKQLKMTNSKNITLLIRKYLEDKCSPDELASIIRFFQANEQDDQIQAFLYEYWENTPSFQHKIAKEELAQMLDSIHYQINLDETKEVTLIKKLSYYAVRVAAVLFVPLLIASIWMFSPNNTYNQDSYITLQTPMGSKLKTTLPDGTEVWQNAGTTLKYPGKFTKNNREVILTGEAYFHVSSDKRHPFYVKTTDGTIKVTGTRFNISAFPDDNFSSVVLEEGHVSYTPVNGTKGPIKLKPDEQIIYKKEFGSLTKQKTDVEKYTSWTEGKLIFRNDPLSDVVTRLKRWYNADITLADPEGKLSKHPFTMTVQNETLPQVLEYISEAANLHLEKQDIGKNEKGTLIKTKYVISKAN